MPWYEVEVECKKYVAVEADTPEEAEEKAEDHFIGDWNRVEVNSLEEPLTDEFVKEYQSQGEVVP